MSAPPSQDVPYRFCPKCAAGLELRSLRAHEPERLVCVECAFIFFLDPKLAAGTLFEDGGRLVLLRRGIEPGYGKWVFPGGFVDRGETVRDAAIRETREEAGIEVSIRELLDVYSYPGSPVVVVVYAARWISGTLEAADETLEVERFDTRKIPWDNLAFPSTREALETYIARYL